MCKCAPDERTPWCDNPGCETPTQQPTRTPIMGEHITVMVTYRVLAGRAYTILEDNDGNRYLKLETFNPPQEMEPYIWEKS